MSTKREKMLCSIAAVLTDQPRLTMEQVAQAIGISRATLHRLFPNRDAVIEELAQLALARSTEAIDAVAPEEGPVDEALRRLVDSFFPHAELYLFLNRTKQQCGANSRYDAEWAPHEERIRNLFRRGQEDGTLRIDMPAQWMLDALAALLFAAAESVRAGRLASAEAATMVSAMLLDGTRRRRIVHARVG
ncbi:MAG: TetR/AcrR family transcriptional regulator [Burkholderiaceae bacterium]